MAKIANLIKAKVVECSPATDEKDIGKNLKWVVILESEKKITQTRRAPIISAVNLSRKLSLGIIIWRWSNSTSQRENPSRLTPESLKNWS